MTAGLKDFDHLWRASTQDFDHLPRGWLSELILPGRGISHVHRVDRKVRAAFYKCSTSMLPQWSALSCSPNPECRTNPSVITMLRYGTVLTMPPLYGAVCLLYCTHNMDWNVVCGVWITQNIQEARQGFVVGGGRNEPGSVHLLDISSRCGTTKFERIFS